MAVARASHPYVIFEVLKSSGSFNWKDGSFGRYLEMSDGQGNHQLTAVRYTLGRHPNVWIREGWRICLVDKEPGKVMWLPSEILSTNASKARVDMEL